MTTTVERGSRATGAPASRERVIARVAFWSVAVIGVLYVPLAVNYTWHLFDHGASFLQQGVNEAVNGSAYENGPASVNGVRTADYTEHRWVMLVHTVLGGLALLLAFFQFSPAIRRRWIVVHRWTGRVYLALMTVSMVTAIVFLSLADIIHIDGGRAFDLQLWGLALGTLATAWIAFAAIRARDVVTHQAWMAMNLSLMLTAPLLRVGWIGLGPFSDNTLLDNLGYSSIALGVVAPAGGALAFAFSQRFRRRDRAVPASAPLSTYGVLAVVVLLGEVAFVAASYGWIPGDVADGVWFHTVPLVALFGFCAAAALGRRSAGDGLREQLWRWYAVGAALSPWAGLVTALAFAPVIGGVEAVVVGMMLGAVGPIVAAFALAVHQSGRWPVVPQRA